MSDWRAIKAKRLLTRVAKNTGLKPEDL